MASLKHHLVVAAAILTVMVTEKHCCIIGPTLVLVRSILACTICSFIALSYSSNCTTKPEGLKDHRPNALM